MFTDRLLVLKRLHDAKARFRRCIEMPRPFGKFGGLKYLKITGAPADRDVRVPDYISGRLVRYDCFRNLTSLA